MNAQDIENYLSELGSELVNLGIDQAVQVLLLGGAFMLTQTALRRSTEDVDVFPLNQEGENVANVAVALWNASRLVAEKHKLPYSWFNTIIADFVRTAGPVPIQTLWHTYGPLEVYLPPGDYVLVLKLLANREKDQRDITELCKRFNIHTLQQAQALIDSYMPDPELQRLFITPDTLDKLFPSI